MIGPALLAGLALGAATIPHCLGMCGPLAAFACRGGGGARAPVRYQLGRTIAYVSLGALFGGVGSAVVSALPVSWASTITSWALAIALAVAALRLWRGSAPADDAAQPIVLRRGRGRGGRGPSLFQRALAVVKRDPFAVGLLTGILPCGALFAALVLAAGTGSPVAGAAVMLGFVTASGVGLLVAGALVARVAVLRRPELSRIVAVVLAVGALLLVLRPIPTIGSDRPACHAPQHDARSL